MAFFKSFQQNLPSVNISSILDSVTSRVDDLANAVSDVTYAVSDQLTEQVTTIINKVDEGENSSSGQESGQTSASQERRPSNKSMWPMSKDSEISHSISKNSQTSDSTEAEYTPSQLEWEWRDGCWRVKKTEAELAEEEKRKKEQEELQADRERRRKERREKQLEKEAKSKRNKEESQEAELEEEADALEKTDGNGNQAAQLTSDEHDEAPQSPSNETENMLHKHRQNDEGEGEEEMEDSLEGGGSDEEEATVKNNKSDKSTRKVVKEDLKKAETASDGEKKKEKEKKTRKKKSNQGQRVCCFLCTAALGVLFLSFSFQSSVKVSICSSCFTFFFKRSTGLGLSDKCPVCHVFCPERVLSDSEEALAQQNTTSVWSSKQATEQGGFSSEASSERGEGIGSTDNLLLLNTALSWPRPCLA